MTVTDSLSSTYTNYGCLTQTVGSTTGYGGYACIFVGVASSSGADTITLGGIATTQSASFVIQTRGYGNSVISSNAGLYSGSSKAITYACGVAGASGTLSVETAFMQINDGSGSSLSSGYTSMSELSTYSFAIYGSGNVLPSWTVTSAASTSYRGNCVSINLNSGVATSNVTSTKTLYQVNAPNPNNFLYWLFPILFITLGIGIPLEVFARRDGGLANISEKTLVTIIIFGAMIGSLAGVLAGVMNFIWVILCAFVLALWIWKGR